MKKILLTVLALSLHSVVAATYKPVIGESMTTNVVPGVWNGYFEYCKAYAEENNVPLVVFWAKPGCGMCEELEKAVKKSGFKKWMAERALVMNFAYGSGKHNPAKAKSFARDGLHYNTKKRNFLSDFPFLAVYFKNKDGEYVKYNFSGRNGAMPCKEGSLEQQFMDSVDLILTEWKKPETYTGGNFSVAGTNAAHRLEAVLGKTTAVGVPLFRKSAESASTNTLKAVFGTEEIDSCRIEWAVNESNKIVDVLTTIEGASVDSDIVLELFDDTATNKVDSSSITFVEDSATSVLNPKWIGEAFGFGEWTMDLDAALSKAAETEGAHTLALSTGALWCPYCQSLEEKVLCDPKFVAWAKTNNVNLVVLDNPKRSTDDVKDDKGAIVSVGKHPNGAAPTLLRHEPSAQGVSGAAYLSRKGISVEAAETVLQRNHDLLYEGGSLCAPESLRTGYPTLILVNADGTAAGRLLSGSNSSKYDWGLSVDETIDRLSELLLLAGGDEKSSRPSTTEASLSVGGDDVSGSVQVNASSVFYRLDGVPAGEVRFSASDPDLTLTVYETASTLSMAKVLKTAKGNVTVDFASSSNKFIAVSFDTTDNLAVYGTNTTREFLLASSCVLKPLESLAKYTPTGTSVSMRLEAGLQYRLTGFGDLTGLAGLEPNGDDLYTAGEAGLYSLPVTDGNEIAYQIWNPGIVEFSAVSYQFLESSITGAVKVVRKNGSSGASSVKVFISDAGTLAEERYDWTDVVLSWADGEEGEKIIPFVMIADAVYEEESYLALQLAPEEPCFAGVSTNGAVIAVLDSDDPCFAKSSHELSAYLKFGAGYSFDTANIKGSGSVRLKKTGGTLPSGVSLKYDRNTQQVVMSGSPKKPGEYVVTYTLTQNGKTGVEATLKIVVEDPAQYNPYLNKAYRNKEVILFSELGPEEDILAGKLLISITAQNSITAKYQGTGKKSVSLKGQWNAVDKESGSVTSVLTTKNGAELALELTKDGILKAVRLAGVENDFGTEFSGACSLSKSSFERYAGYYTVTLPAIGDGDGSLEAAGTGYLTLTVNADGKVKYSGKLGNGVSVSDSAYLVADTEDEDHAYLPIFKRLSKDMLSLVLDIRADAKEIGHDVNGLQTVFLADHVVALHSHIEDGFEYDVKYAAFGAYYTQKTTLGGWCDIFGLSPTNMVLSIDGACVSSADSVYGEADFGGNAVLDVSGNNFTIKNAKQVSLRKLTFDSRNGLFKGSAEIVFANGKKTTGTINGVLLPGWINGCGDCSDAVSRPFASGTITYADGIPVTVKGRTRTLRITRSAAVDIEADVLSLDADDDENQ